MSSPPEGTEATLFTPEATPRHPYTIGQLMSELEAWKAGGGENDERMYILSAVSDGGYECTLCFHPDMNLNLAWDVRGESPKSLADAIIAAFAKVQS